MGEKRPFLFIIVFSLLWLAACGRDEPENTPTPTVTVGETAVCLQMMLGETAVT